MKKITAFYSKNKFLVWAGIAAVIFYLYWKNRDEVDSAAITATGGFDENKADPEKIVKKGDRGPEVSVIQRLMKRDGADLGDYGPEKDGIDGVFGNKTLSALKAIKGKEQISISQYLNTPNVPIGTTKGEIVY